MVVTSGEFATTPPEERQALLAGLVEEGSEPGLLAYRDGEAVGWCALGPRSRYARMMSPRSRVVNCFFVRARREGVARRLLAAAVRFSRLNGASRLEAYPVDTAARAGMQASDLFPGTLTMFLAAGFDEVGRPNGRPLVRLGLRSWGRLNLKTSRPSFTTCSPAAGFPEPKRRVVLLVVFILGIDFLAGFAFSFWITRKTTQCSCLQTN